MLGCLDIKIQQQNITLFKKGKLRTAYIKAPKQILFYRHKFEQK
jgi:hypothetical protein